MSTAAYPHPPGPSTGPEDFLKDLGRRLEFRELAKEPAGIDPRTLFDLGLGDIPAYRIRQNGDDPGAQLEIKGLQLHALQEFVDRVMSPEGGSNRFLLLWDTGTGKTIAAITIAQRYAQLYRSIKSIPAEERPTIFVIGFTRSVIQAEMLRDPKHGFITLAELRELRSLRIRAHKAGPGSPEARQYNGYLGTMRRLLTDRMRGGYYRFYGYKEFAMQLFVVTPLGEQHGVKVMDLFKRSQDNESADQLDQMAVFARRIAEIEKKHYVRINTDLLLQLRRGLIVADEIHNVYNVHDPNMYGVALQYVFNAFMPDDAPRAVFMSATPMSGGPTEIVDLLNLLVPRKSLPGGRPVTREDIFAKQGQAGNRYRPGALETITRLATGRVSYLTVSMEQGARASDPKYGPLFPERIFEGEDITDIHGKTIPYMKFVPCKLSKEQESALSYWAESNPSRENWTRQPLPSVTEYSLYDMVFPNPSPSDTHPLYDSPSAQTITSTLARADPKWLTEQGIVVMADQGSDSPAGRGAAVIGGRFLELPSLEKFSSKYANFVRGVHEAVKRGPGKILAYHDRIRNTGVALLAEILRNNGFVGLAEPATPATICAVCGLLQKSHKGRGKSSSGASEKGHQYIPARFATVTGAMDTGSRERALNKFNLSANLEGYEIRVLIGSQVIAEGLNFQAVRHQMILSIPRNISTLVQILGRPSRRGAYKDLPPDERNYRVQIYVTVGSAGQIYAPDLVKLSRKMHDYIQIQQGVAALRRGAVNSFLPQSEIVATAAPSLEGQPFSLAVKYSDIRGPVEMASYYAYRHSDQDVGRLAKQIQTLFQARPVWSREDLETALAQTGLFGNESVDTTQAPKGLIALALGLLTRPSAQAYTTEGAALSSAHLRGVDGEPLRIVAVRGDTAEFYIAAPLDGRGEPVVDIESYARRGEAWRRAGHRWGFSLRNYVHSALRTRNFEKRLADFIEVYPGGGSSVHLFVDYDKDFHYQLLDHLVSGGLTPAQKRSKALVTAVKVYAKFKVLVTAQQVRKATGFKELASRAVARKSPQDPVGYVKDGSVRIYVPPQRSSLAGYVQGEPSWQTIPLDAVGYSPRHVENSTTVGYVEVRGGKLQFKIRDPVHHLEQMAVRDMRSLGRGAVCLTRPRQAQLKLAQKLCKKSPATLAKLSSSSLCALIRDKLLEEEAKARSGRNGMRDGTRWFYLFNDKLPTVRLARDFTS